MTRIRELLWWPLGFAFVVVASAIMLLAWAITALSIKLRAKHDY